MIGNHVDGANCLKGSNPLLSVANLPGPLVKRLRHRPFTAVTRVRIPYGLFYLFFLKGLKKRAKAFFFSLVHVVIKVFLFLIDQSDRQYLERMGHTGNYNQKQ